MARMLVYGDDVVSEPVKAAEESSLQITFEESDLQFYRDAVAKCEKEETCQCYMQIKDFFYAQAVLKAEQAKFLHGIQALKYTDDKDAVKKQVDTVVTTNADEFFSEIMKQVNTKIPELARKQNIPVKEEYSRFEQ